MTPRASHLLLLLLAACDGGSLTAAAPQPVVAAAPDAPGPPPGTGPRMTRHFEDSLFIKDAVIAGRIDELRAPALRLVEWDGDEPPAWRPYIAATARHAKALLVAADLDAAALAAAGLARTCGDCHAATVGPAFPARVAPAITSRDPRQRMRRHQWAADRLWEAMVGHSDAAWTSGAAALADPALLRADYPPDVEIEGDPLVVEARLRAFGARAATARDWDERVAIYGGLLATCAACHADGR
ncbi:MAG: hypothetical protein JNL82_36180 [Myxococcales bacterium]|nr:hypothetical protein [Myxococcales bacterium]